MTTSRYLTALLALAATASAQPALNLTTAGAPRAPLFVEAGPWSDVTTEESWKALLAKAKSENKLLLVDFTGSDWCGWCIKLKNEVFSTEAFVASAPKDFILVEIDFPRKTEVAAEVKAYRQSLAQQYAIAGYPTILLIDGDGKKVAKTGYQAGGPENYLTHLAKLKGEYTAVQDLRKKAEAGDKDAIAACAKLDKTDALKGILGSVNKGNAEQVANDLFDKYLAGDILEGPDANFPYLALLIKGATNKKNVEAFDKIRTQLEALTDPKAKAIVPQMKLDDMRKGITGSAESEGSEEAAPKP
ncbi:MAG: thioredoxin family protein [Planctomycetota bacterium]